MSAAWSCAVSGCWRVSSRAGHRRRTPEWVAVDKLLLGAHLCLLQVVWRRDTSMQSAVTGSTQRHTAGSCMTDDGSIDEEVTAVQQQHGMLPRASSPSSMSQTPTSSAPGSRVRAASRSHAQPRRSNPVSAMHACLFLGPTKRRQKCMHHESSRSCGLSFGLVLLHKPPLHTDPLCAAGSACHLCAAGRHRWRR